MRSVLASEIRDFHIAEREEDISYYAGYVGSAFMFGRALTSVFWGVVADRYGRKPVIIIGTITVIVFNTLFGLSVNFWMAIITRFLLGSFNGLLRPVKAYAAEVCREEHQALGLSTISTAWSIGLIIGPALGGLLAQEERVVIPPNADASDADNVAASVTSHGIQVALEFKPVEHPIEPLDSDQPVNCPQPEPSILNVMQNLWI